MGHQSGHPGRLIEIEILGKKKKIQTLGGPLWSDRPSIISIKYLPQNDISYSYFQKILN